MVARFTLVALAVAALGAAAYVVLSRNAPSGGQRDDAIWRGPLVPAEMAPKRETDIVWFLIGNRLLAASDDPGITKLLFRALHEPVAYVREEVPLRATTILAPSSFFLVGLLDGRVLVADESRLLGDDRIGKGLEDVLVSLMPAGLQVHSADSPFNAAITPSRDMRLGMAVWRLVAVRDTRKRSEWKPETTPSPLLREVVDAALAHTRRIFPDEPRDRFGGGIVRSPWPAARVRFGTPVSVILVPVDMWDPNYHHARQVVPWRSPKEWTVPGRVQAYSVEPLLRYVEEAVVYPSHSRGFADVYLRLAGSGLWLHAGLVPLRYP